MTTGTGTRGGKAKLGGLCKRGHDHEGTGKTLRNAGNGACIECQREMNARAHAKKRGDKPPQEKKSAPKPAKRTGGGHRGDAAEAR